MIRSNYFLFISCLFFFLFKLFSIKLTNFDLFGDEAQYWLWSQNPDFGYYSKPPLLAWIIALFCSVFGSTFFAIKMISVFIYCPIALVIFFITKKLYNNKNLAFLTAVTFFLMPAVSVSSFLVSTDILLILFWSLAMMMVLIIKEKPKIINFIILGIFIGLALMTKYAAIYFLICLVLLFFEKNMRSVFLINKASCLYCVLTIMLIVAPNIIWNYNNNWVTFEHTSNNAALDRIHINITGGIEFVLSQIAMIGPIIFGVYVLIFSKYFKFDFNTKFLLIFSIPIFLIILLESILVRVNANWAAVSLISFLILFVHTAYQINLKFIYYNNIFNFLMGIIFFALIGTTSSYEPFKRINGINSFAKDVSTKIKKYNNLVISDRMLFSNLSYIYRNSEVKLYVPFSPKSKITNHFQMTNALPPTFNKSFIFIGYEDQINYLMNKYKVRFLEEKNVVFQEDLIKIYEVLF